MWKEANWRKCLQCQLWSFKFRQTWFIIYRNLSSREGKISFFLLSFLLLKSSSLSPSIPFMPPFHFFLIFQNNHAFKKRAQHLRGSYFSINIYTNGAIRVVVRYFSLVTNTFYSIWIYHSSSEFMILFSYGMEQLTFQNVHMLSIRLCESLYLIR